MKLLLSALLLAVPFCSMAQSTPDAENPLYIDASGRVGIGTTNLVNKFTVAGNTDLLGNTTMKGNQTINGNATINGNTDMQGNLKLNGRTLNHVMPPPGSIMMYSGAYSDNFDENGLGRKGTLMEGWAVCNGANNTPDLQGRFIVGANVIGTPYRLGATGGEATHTLTISEMPTHTHKFSKPMDDYSSYNDFGGHKQVVRTAVYHQGDESKHLSIQGEGGGQPHENRPPFYALFYIMKL